MSVICDVIKLTAGKVTSRDLGHKHFFSFFKSKNRKIITNRDLYKKKSTTEESNVKLTD